MIAAVCDTPYQLMSAILVAGEVARGEDIIFFMNTYLYFEEQSFDYSVSHDSVKAILYYGKKHMGASKLLAGLVDPAKMLRHIDGWAGGMDITAVIASRTTYMATYIYNEYSKRHPGMPLYLIEEGIGEYSNNMVDTRFTKVCSLLRRKTHMDHVACAYFSAPALYPYETPFPIKKIPLPNSWSRGVIDSVFGSEKLAEAAAALDARHCIFLSDPNSCEIPIPAQAAACDALEHRIIDVVAGAAGLDDMIIKVHPIDPGFKKEGVESFYSKLPMESLIYSIDCRSKYFVSSISTAMLTPKLLFDEEPCLIFTYKILDRYISMFLTDSAHKQRYYDFMEGVMGMYRDPSRCAAPSTLDELRQVVGYMKEKTAGSGAIK